MLENGLKMHPGRTDTNNYNLSFNDMLINFRLSVSDSNPGSVRPTHQLKENNAV